MAEYVTWVVEDDPVQLSGIGSMLAQSSYASSLTVVLVAGSQELSEKLDRADEPAPDIVLMDMDLGEDNPHGADLVSADDILKNAQIIYTTAYLGLVPEAYQTEHRYLLAKPIKEHQLNSSLERAIACIEQAEADALTFSFDSKVVRVPYSTVKWIESRGHRVTVFTDSGEYLANESLRSFSARLPRRFVRTHKSYVVNLDQAFSLEQDSLAMADGSSIPVSRTYRKAVKETLMDRLVESR